MTSLSAPQWMHTWASQHTGSPLSAPTGADSEPGIAWGVSVEVVFIANRQSCFRHRTSFATVPRQCPEDGNVSEPARGGRRLRAPTRGPGGARRPIGSAATSPANARVLGIPDSGDASEPARWGPRLSSSTSGDESPRPRRAAYFRGPGGARTRDPRIKSPMLYQLSYRPYRSSVPLS